MHLCIHRGTHQIGGSCVEIKSSGNRIIIDLGLPLDAEGDGEKYLSEIPGLDGCDDSLSGILISHPHLDHFGLLSYINEKVPVHMGKDARKIIENASPFLPGNWPAKTCGIDFELGKTFKSGPFEVTPYLIDHSAYDAYAFLIEADNKRIFYSGDLRMHGRKAALTEKLMLNPPRDIDILLMEGSSLGRIENDKAFPSEKDIEDSFVKTFSQAEGLVLVQTSSQNIDRIVTIFRACKKSGKRLIIDLYTAVILEATGNKHIPQSDWPGIAVYIPHSQRVQILKNKWFDLLKKHSKNRIFIESFEEISAGSVLLFRPLHMKDLEKAHCLDRAVYIYSQWEGYWDSRSYSGLRTWLIKHEIPKVSIHTSGHASPVDLKRFAVALEPKCIVPIHTFTPDKYLELFSNVVLHNDGEYWEV
jgi:ribonuclease J